MNLNKFNLDDSDTCNFYWPDLRQKPEIMLSSYFGGGFVIVFGTLGFFSKSLICWTLTKMKSDDDMGFLKKDLLPMIDDGFGIEEHE